MKPYIHAQSSARKYGGQPDDYLKIHDWFDQTKSHFGDNRHRAILHSAFGIFLAEQVFGHNIKNSDGREVSVRDLGEQHVIEDMKFIPTVADYLGEMEYKNWMHGKGFPASYKKLQDRANSKKQTAFIPFTTSPEPQIIPQPDRMYDGSGLLFSKPEPIIPFDDTLDPALSNFDDDEMAADYEPQMLVD